MRVATCGTTPGATGALANKRIKNRNIDAYFSVKMVDNYTPIFDISTKELQEKFLIDTEETINVASATSFLQAHGGGLSSSYITPAMLADYIEWLQADTAAMGHGLEINHRRILDDGWRPNGLHYLTIEESISAF